MHNAEQRLQEIIMNQLAMDESQWDPDQQLFEIADSLDLVEIITDLEAELSLDIDDETVGEALRCRTFGELTKFLLPLTGAVL
ncbi:MAG: acyl carrier protein [Firmicutes bacterium]|nr:acyl carrier protein [Bacillota bacterium]